MILSRFQYHSFSSQHSQVQAVHGWETPLPFQYATVLYGKVLLVFGLFGALFYRIIRIAKKARDDFSLFLTCGIVAMLFIQVFINIGMNIGILPIAGIPLPLLSYGGSSLVITLMALGIIESIAVRQKGV